MAKTPSIDLDEVRSVTDFQRNAKTHITRLRKTKAPMALTQNGAVTVVVQDAATYQKSMRRLEEYDEHARFIAAIHEGLADIEAGRTVALEDARAWMEKKFGTPR